MLVLGTTLFRYKEVSTVSFFESNKSSFFKGELLLIYICMKVTFFLVEIDTEM
jgi:hypothetical protein